MQYTTTITFITIIHRRMVLDKNCLKDEEFEMDTKDHCLEALLDRVLDHLIFRTKPTDEDLLFKMDFPVKL